MLIHYYSDSWTPEMPTNAHPFADLVQRTRVGDEAAAAKLVRLYEPAIRRAVRMNLTDPRLRRSFDSMDVCQSVFAQFFVQAAAGRFDLETSEQLLALLVRMASNKLLDYVRRQHADRRDLRRLAVNAAEMLETLAAREDTPSHILEARELLDAVQGRLSEEERYLMDQRGEGRSWEELAGELHTTPDGLRMKMRRCLDRVARSLDREASSHARVLFTAHPAPHGESSGFAQSTARRSTPTLAARPTHSCRDLSRT